MFGPAQLKTLNSLIDRIVPPDDYPGASDAGVADYILRQLDHDLSQYADLYLGGLAALDAEAMAGAGQSFAALPATAQDDLLSLVEQGHVRLPWPVAPRQFFQAVVKHVMEGYYSNPSNGGNRGGIAWQMIGFKGEKPAGEDQ
jgi:hypothetical protein